MGVTFAGTTLHGLPAPSAAATGTAVDPVAAIQRQLVKGRGVRVVERNTFNSGDGWRRFKPTQGLIGFGDGKVVATDLVNHHRRSVREICIGKRRWEYDPAKKRSNGKKWVTFPVIFAWQCQLRLEVGNLRLDEPDELAAVLATTTSKRPASTYDGVPTTLHQGVMSARQLWEARPEMHPEQRDVDYRDWPIEWRLWIGDDGLVRRTWVKWRQPEGRFKGVTDGQGWFGFIDDIRYSDWGMRLTIKPPPPSQTTALKLPKT
ncbi:hypothetical protein [Nonomuraea endophytica]|uniref:hypothetical protein n=1 Tax=Nonomuraea endophytica TaxID=714136 RepID=UPI0037C9950B